MAFDQLTILTILGVLAILVGVVFFNNMRAMRPAAKAVPTTPAGEPILQRYVHHEGAVVGQAIAVEGDKVLLKQGNVHKAIPLAQLERSGDELRLLGTVDWLDCEKDGAAWAERLAAANTPAVVEEKA